MRNVRTCVGCKLRTSKEQMIRFVCSRDGQIAVDLSSGGMSGRGSYVCPRLACLEKALGKSAFSRAYRRNVNISREQLLTTLRLRLETSLRALAAQVVGDGRARKNNPQSDRDPESPRADLVWSAGSERVRDRFERWAGLLAELQRSV
jgi:predicted RNA-binding protein YlxR (DUF448 family)